VITGTNAKDGDVVVYFPLECSISAEFLSWSDSYEDKTLNKNPDKKGFFNKHGRVRAISLRGEKSEGYMVPAKLVEDFAKDVLKLDVTLKAGEDFDLIGDHLFVKKYVPVSQSVSVVSTKKTKGKTKKYESKLVENQFRFHEDTAQLKRNIYKISPDTIIAITDKIHGSNYVVGNVLIKRQLSWKDKFAKWLGAKIQETEYGKLHSSRSVIKNANFGMTKGDDAWEKVSDRVFTALKEGISVTGELYGFHPSGKPIQPMYDYGMKPGETGFNVFKVTYTSPTGDVYVFSHEQTVAWCQKYGIEMPRTFYYGKAKDLFPELAIGENWNEKFLEKLKEKFLEKKCDLCANDVFAEGVVVRIDTPNEWNVFKLKSFAFLNHESKELDKGIGGEEG
jgi:hypothetical protein